MKKLKSLLTFSMFFVLIALTVGCSRGSKVSNTASNVADKASNMATKASNTAQKASSVNPGVKKPEMIGKEIFAAFKTNNAAQFEKYFIHRRHQGDLNAMVNSVDFSDEQKQTSMELVEKTLKFLSDNNSQAIKNLFQRVRATAEEQGIDWNNAEYKDVEVNVVPVRDFAINMTVWEVLINFVNKGNDHQLKIPTAYNLDNGILIGDAKFAY